MFSTSEIERLVELGLSGAKARAIDTTGTQDHFELTVVAPLFKGKSLVERHRMVYQALGKVVGAEIHALSLKTFSPEEVTP